MDKKDIDKVILVGGSTRIPMVQELVEKELAKEKGVTSIKIDTHEDNEAMRRSLIKNGFDYCGIIYLTDGNPRVAYEKLLD